MTQLNEFNVYLFKVNLEEVIVFNFNNDNNEMQINESIIIHVGQTLDVSIAGIKQAWLQKKRSVKTIELLGSMKLNELLKTIETVTGKRLEKETKPIKKLPKVNYKNTEMSLLYNAKFISDKYKKALTKTDQVNLNKIINKMENYVEQRSK
jgi:hypothetical protein